MFFSYKSPNLFNIVIIYNNDITKLKKMSIIIKNSNKSVNKLDKALLVLYYVDKEKML